MRVVLLIAAALFLLLSATTARAEDIGLFSDASYTNCELVDTGGGLVTVYVVHSTSGGATGSQFMVAAESGATLTYMSETSAFALAIGNVQSGISLGYGECLYSDILLATVTYLASGSSLACSTLRVVPDPAAPTGAIEVVNCSQSKLEAIGASLVINSDGSCECGPNSKATNWGRIKAKYRE